MSLHENIRFAKRYRRVAGVVITIITVALFVHFFIHQPQYVHSLRRVSLLTVLAILALNAILMLTLTVIYQATLSLCNHHISFKEQLLLAVYSSIANFFGPFQSGPGVRAVYLKSKHNVKLRDYTLASLVYYACFAIISGLFLLAASSLWWEGLAGAMVIGGCIYLASKWFNRQRETKKTTSFQLRLLPLGVLIAATFVQVIIVFSYYLLELRAFGVHASLRQTMSYTGAANFALFISLTPDAIGIRESFLLLARHLHRLSMAVIVTANVLDRAIYGLYLGILLLIVLGFHIKTRLGVSSLSKEA